MKKGILILPIVIIILLVSLRFFYTPRPTKVTTPTPTTTSASYCTTQDVQASLELHPGAGNVYGTFNLKNTSSHTCQILGGHFIDLKYDTNAIKNIKLTHIGQNQSQPFNLSSNQTLYSQVHYPNGPQCSTKTNTTNVSFTYNISPTAIITFKNQNGDIPEAVQTCESLTEITEVQIWNISHQPI